MSHDRGCFKCGEDRPYGKCPRADCPKRPARPEGEPSLTVHNVAAATRPVCTSCNREQPLWGNCFRVAAECPVRASTVTGRPATRIISVREPGYEIVMFLKPDGSAQAIISRPGDKEPTDVLIASPLPGRCIVIERKGDAFDVLYKEVQP